MLKFKEGDAVKFSSGTINVRGYICGHVFKEDEQLWLVNIWEHSGFAYYPFSCTCVAEELLESDLEPRRSEAFKAAIAGAKELAQVMGSGKYCLGFCSRLKREGPRVYSENYAIIGGICTKCHKTVYKGNK